MNMEDNELRDLMLAMLEELKRIRTELHAQSITRARLNFRVTFATECAAQNSDALSKVRTS